MSRTRRNFSAKFKSELVLEVLKGEKELNVIATENGSLSSLCQLLLYNTITLRIRICGKFC